MAIQVTAAPEKAQHEFDKSLKTTLQTRDKHERILKPLTSPPKDNSKDRENDFDWSICSDIAQYLPFYYGQLLSHYAWSQSDITSQYLLSPQNPGIDIPALETYAYGKCDGHTPPACAETPKPAETGNKEPATEQDDTDPKHVAHDSKFAKLEADVAVIKEQTSEPNIRAIVRQELDRNRKHKPQLRRPPLTTKAKRAVLDKWVLYCHRPSDVGCENGRKVKYADVFNTFKEEFQKLGIKDLVDFKRAIVDSRKTFPETWAKLAKRRPYGQKRKIGQRTK